MESGDGFRGASCHSCTFPICTCRATEICIGEARFALIPGRSPTCSCLSVPPRGPAALCPQLPWAMPRHLLKWHDAVISITAACFEWWFRGNVSYAVPRPGMNMFEALNRRPEICICSKTVWSLKLDFLSTCRYKVNLISPFGYQIHRQGRFQFHVSLATEEKKQLMILTKI